MNQYEQRAAEVMKDHQYTPLCQTDQLIAWRCQEPGTSIYAFDILITRFGIAIVGDIDSLTFRVGLSHGLEFLAGDDVAYYIFSKLEHAHQKRVLDLEATKHLIADRLSDTLADWVYAPSWIEEDEASAAKFDRIMEWLEDYWMQDGSHPDAHAVLSAMRDITDLGDTAEEAGHLLSEHSDILGLGGEFYEYISLTPCSGVMQELYLVRHAAKQILAMETEKA